MCNFLSVVRCPLSVNIFDCKGTDISPSPKSLRWVILIPYMW